MLKNKKPFLIFKQIKESIKKAGFLFQGLRIGIVLFFMIWIPWLIFEALNSHKKNASPLFENDNKIYLKKPVSNQKALRKILKFEGTRPNEEKVFKIKLNDGVYQVSLSLALAFDGKNTELTEELMQVQPLIKDRIQYIVASKTYHDINSTRKRQDLLKKAIIHEINSLLRHGHIEDLYFTQFLINKL